VKNAWLRWWFDLLSEFHHWRWDRLQRRANVHYELGAYCENRVDELDQEASNV